MIHARHGLQRNRHRGRFTRRQVPGTHRSLVLSGGGARGPWRELPYALDNGAWPAFLHREEWDEDAWRALVVWALASGIMPLWALVPDVVGEREATIERWARFSPWVRSKGLRCGFAVQNGMTFDDVPDDDCVLFLGGDDAWKDAAIAPWCTRFPGRVHVGRVNYWDRLVRSWRAGAVSVDGTGWFRKGRTIGSSQANDLRKFLRETSQPQPQPLRSIA